MTFDINQRVFVLENKFPIDDENQKVFKIIWDKSTNGSLIPKILCRGRDIGELYTLKTLKLLHP